MYFWIFLLVYGKNSCGTLKLNKRGKENLRIGTEQPTPLPIDFSKEFSKCSVWISILHFVLTKHPYKWFSLILFSGLLVVVCVCLYCSSSTDFTNRFLWGCRSYCFYLVFHLIAGKPWEVEGKSRNCNCWVPVPFSHSFSVAEWSIGVQRVFGLAYVVKNFLWVIDNVI